MAEPRVFSKSLSCVPKFTSDDVVKSVKMHSSTKGNKLDKGYKFVHEEFIHHYQGPQPDPYDGIWKQIMPGAAPNSHGCVGWVSEME